MNSDTTKKVLMPSQIQPGIQLKGAKSIGDCHPPRNMIEATADNRIMFAYSARKKMAKPLNQSDDDSFL